MFDKREKKESTILPLTEVNTFLSTALLDKFDMLMRAPDANSSGQTQSSSTSCHVFSVSVEVHNFNSSHKTFNLALNGATLEGPCKVVKDIV